MMTLPDASTPVPYAPGQPVHPGEGFDFMNLLARHDLHELTNERWNLYGQFTFIGGWKLAFPAAYTNLNQRCTVGCGGNSLLPTAEGTYTSTQTLFLGIKLWPGAEAYAVPEIISERPLSNLLGLGGAIQNFELQKQGSEIPKLYLSRVYIKQTIGLGGATDTRDSGPYQVAATVPRRRLVLSLGNFSVLDFFDKNSVTGDPRRGFFNMAFMTHAAYDFAADARGYTWGGIAELFYDDWELRFGHIITPLQPNQLPLDFRFYKYFGEQVEVAHNHKLGTQPGAVRLLGYRNWENMGSFTDAIRALAANPLLDSAPHCGSRTPYDSSDQSAPDLCFVRKPNAKRGVGINVEQQVTKDVGLFARGMYSDGQTEVYSYTSADRSVSAGTMIKGSPWRRARDLFGLAYAASWISVCHAQYLNMGGVDGFIGDGRIHVAVEQVVDAFYSFDLVSSLWLSADYQHIWNPAFNADRGPVDIFGARLHGEF